LFELVISGDLGRCNKKKIKIELCQLTADALTLSNHNYLPSPFLLNGHGRLAKLKRK
jgi:hypothetical protein